MPIKDKNLFEYLNKYEKDQILRVIPKLTKSELSVLRTLFGRDYTLPIRRDGHYLEVSMFMSTLWNKLEGWVQALNDGTKTIFEYFSDYNKDKIAEAILLLNDDEKKILSKITNNNIENPIIFSKLNPDEKRLLNEIIAKLKGIIEDLKIYEEELELGKPKIIYSTNKSKHIVLDKYEYYSEFKEYLDKALLYLTDYEMSLFNKFFNGSASETEKRKIYSLVTPKLRKIVGLLKANNGYMPGNCKLKVLQAKDIKDYFKESDYLYLEEAISLLSVKYQNIISRKFKKQEILTEEEETLLRNEIVKKIKANIELVKNKKEVIETPKIRVVAIKYSDAELLRKAKKALDIYLKETDNKLGSYTLYDYKELADLIRHPLFQYLTTLMPFKECMVVLLSLWHGKSSEQIARFLEISIEEVEQVANNAKVQYLAIINEVYNNNESVVLNKMLQKR